LAGENTELRERILKAIQNQKPKTRTVLSSLLAVFDELGYLPKEAIEEVARITDSTINDVWGVASFYTNFRFTPPARHRVEVCWGAPCHVMGAMRIAKEALDALGLVNEGDTPDGRVSLGFNTCLGACAQAPVISVDHQLMGRMTPERTREILKGLDGAGHNGHHQPKAQPPKGREPRRHSG